MEHVWVRRYESVENIYETLEEQGFSEAVKTITKVGDIAQIEDLLNQWGAKLWSGSSPNSQAVVK